MARPAAGNDRNLGRREIGAADNLDMRIAIERGNRGVSRGAAQAINGLGDKVLFGVGKKIHGQPPCAFTKLWNCHVKMGRSRRVDLAA